MVGKTEYKQNLSDGSIKRSFALIVKQNVVPLFITHSAVMVAVTSNSLAKRSSFKESSFVLRQANYPKLQRTVEGK